MQNHSTGYVYAKYGDFNALGQIGYADFAKSSLTAAPKTSTAYTYYDYNHRLQAMETVDGTGATIQNLSYGFDNIGNIETITDALHGVNQSFTYDEVSRLKTATATCADSSREYNQTYTYDLAGNMTQKTGLGGFAILGWDSKQRPTQILYDENVPDVGERNIVYNQDNKPTEITYNGGSTTYLEYDGNGNRIKKTQNGNTVTYVGRIYEVRGNEVISYIFANGKKIATVTSSHIYFQHGDHLGSTNIVTNENGQLVEEIGYLPFGATLYHNIYNGSTWESAYRFTDQEYDEEYALYNYNARLYDPIMARFISADTVVPDWTNPQTLNRYSYCANNPLKYVDPSGNWFFAALIIGALIGGASAAINGGNILQGMLMGAVTGVVTGGIFHGAGILAEGMSSLGKAAMHFGAGAVSGGINAAVTGGDILQGMAIGAFSAGVAKAIGGDLPGRIASGAIVGGVAAEMTGGSFADGAFQGALTSAMAFIFNDMAHRICEKLTHHVLKDSTINKNDWRAQTRQADGRFDGDGSKEYRFGGKHQGIDLGATLGDDIGAAGDGVVTFCKA